MENSSVSPVSFHTPLLLRGDDAEAVLARRQIGVQHAGARLTGSCQSLSWPSSMYLKRVLFRRDETQGSVVDFEIASQRRQTPVRNHLAVGDDLLDVDRRREFVDGKMGRVDDADARDGHEPHFPSVGLGYSRAVDAAASLLDRAVRSSRKP